MNEDDLSKVIVNAAIKVHSALGAGLLESAYEACLAHELARQGLEVKKQLPFPIEYEGMKLDVGYRLDLLVNDMVVVEIKAVEKLLPVHMAQVLSYLKLGQFKLGFLLNFNVAHMKYGIARIVNGL